MARPDDPDDDPPIPWRDQLRTMIEQGYACGDCGRSTVTEDDPIVLRIANESDEKSESLTVLCGPCAARRARTRSRRPPPP